MDFLSIRKKARERAEAKDAASPVPEAQAGAGAIPPAAQPADPSPRAEPPPVPDRRRRRGDEQVLTEEDLVEGALQARFQGLAPSADARFATWRPGSGPPPVEPDPGSWGAPVEPPRRAEEDAAPVPSEEPVLARAAGRGAAAPAPPPAPADPLEAFFFRPDEEAAIVPALGGDVEAEPPFQRPERIDEFLTFLLGTEEYAVAIDHVREVLRAPAITEVPRAPAHVLGVVTVRGEVVAVVDARGRLGLGGEAATGSRIVIVDAGDGPLGLLVDAVASVVRLPRGAIEPCPQGISAAASECVTGIGRWRDRLFMVIDVGELMHGARPAGER